MSKVPAWKKLGLQVKSEIENDPLSTTTHLDGSVIDNKLAKTLNKKRRAQEDQKDQKDDKTKKPPKRVKLPKSERPPPPEKDQLTYLKQFSQDKENWKFSKQKQNWLLKNIENIPAEYESFLIEYIEGIQGGARDRVVEDLKAVIVSWNEYSKKLEEKVNAELYGQKDEPETEEDKKESEGDKTEPEVVKGPSKDYAIRCKKILMALVDEEIEMEGENVEEPPRENKAVEPETSEAKSEGSEQAEDGEPDNLVIDEVDVEEYDKDIEFEKPKKEEKKEKKEKKVKKEKKEKKEKAKKDHN